MQSRASFLTVRVFKIDCADKPLPTAISNRSTAFVITLKEEVILSSTNGPLRNIAGKLVRDARKGKQKPRGKTLRMSLYFPLDIRQ